MECHAISRHRAKAAKITAAICSIGALHILVQILLYRARVLNWWHAADGVVLLLPALAAFFAYAVILKGFGRARSIPTVFGALALTIFSFWGGMLVALNTYGS